MCSTCILYVEHKKLLPVDSSLQCLFQGRNKMNIVNIHRRGQDLVVVKSAYF